MAGNVHSNQLKLPPPRALMAISRVLHCVSASSDKDRWESLMPRRKPGELLSPWSAPSAGSVHRARGCRPRHSSTSIIAAHWMGSGACGGWAATIGNFSGMHICCMRIRRPPQFGI